MTGDLNAAHAEVPPTSRCEVPPTSRCENRSCEYCAPTPDLVSPSNNLVKLLKKRRRQNAWVKAKRRQVPLERIVERDAVKALESLGMWAPKFGKDGWPDRLVLLGGGAHVWFEFKRVRFSHLTRAQKRRIPRMRERGEVVDFVTSAEQAVRLALQHRRRLCARAG